MMGFAMVTLFYIWGTDALCTRIVTPTDAYSYDLLKTELVMLKRRFPMSLCVEVYGHSREGRALYAAIVGDRCAKRAVLIQASIHGREHMTTTLAMLQLERLLRTGVPAGVCFYILPMTNPDGVTISQTQRSTPAIDAMFERDKKEGAFHGKKERYLREWKANAAGVDLNRNFNALWERVDTHPRPSNANYRGPYPQSEPETKALVSLTMSRQFDATISYHATGSEIYYAFGDTPDVNMAGLSLARHVNKKLRYDILPDSGTSFGGYKDWAILNRRIPSLTIEVGRGSTPLPPEELPEIWRRNRSLPYMAAHWVVRSQRSEVRG